jgi:ATP-dependent NAD(P)H-hydrate dehydratase
MKELLPLARLRALVPPLAAASYKGHAGKIGVLGGCAEYTGAPFYAALSALKIGADLSHVFCDKEAAVPIKSYSPELIVHGCLRAGETIDPAGCAEQVESVCKWFPALTALVVGPGLGRDPTLQSVAEQVVERAIAASLPCVLDADGLAMVLRRPSLVKGSRWTVLTPNKPEMERLAALFAPTTPAEATVAAAEEEATQVQRIARELGGPTLVRKGACDRISDGEALLENVEPGCLKRSGGQGDVLAGSIATMLSWARGAELGGRLPPDAPPPPPLAAYAGCLLTRRFSAAAFAKHRRAMTAPDVIEAIGPVFDAFYTGID